MPTECLKGNFLENGHVDEQEGGRIILIWMLGKQAVSTAANQDRVELWAPCIIDVEHSCSAMREFVG